MLELGPSGSVRGTEVELARASAAAPGASEQAPNQIMELALASSGDHLGVAWSVVTNGVYRTEAAYAATAPAFAPPIDLGEMELGVSGRGNIVVAPLAGGALYVAHRITRGPCHDTSSGAAECTRFARTRLPEADGVRSDGASEIAAPCAPLLPGAITSAGSTPPWFYGVCHEDEGPTTTVFVIQPDPASQYAAAAEVLAGCTPVALARAESGVVLRARCGDDEALARIDAMGHVTHTMRHAVLSTRCEAGRPVLEANDGSVVLTRRLMESESRLEAWLPGTVAPDGSRAAWTGEALLVAAPIGSEGSREVRLRRYECSGVALLRTDMAF